jgi:hypothetical protein
MTPRDERAAAVRAYEAAQALTEAAQEAFAAADDDERREAARALLREANARRRVTWEQLAAAFRRRGVD